MGSVSGTHLAIQMTYQRAGQGWTQVTNDYATPVRAHSGNLDGSYPSYFQSSVPDGHSLNSETINH